ncbi:hypothetical protein PIB30_044525 [Stylosanthes scabra]|uniref:RNase H type-1 domain-containing protein n=1 Tax=Stylosanthes scabra TaxID=79078 RepID=A0ABU6RFW5_9FABA|nr:hypothetical protein [Stylosanthes scabra]
MANSEAHPTEGKWTQAAWFGAQVQCIPSNQPISTLGGWITELRDIMKQAASKEYDIYLSKAAYILWEIWKARNNAIHGNSKPSPNELIFKAKITEIEYLGNKNQHQAEYQVVHHSSNKQQQQTRTQNQGRRKTTVTWHLPPKGWLKCNIDGTYCNLAGKGPQQLFSEMRKGEYSQHQQRKLRQILH